MMRETEGGGEGERAVGVPVNNNTTILVQQQGVLPLKTARE